MPKKKTEFELLPLFDRFISETKKGKRLQKNGKIVKKSSRQNYVYLRNLLVKFSNDKHYPLRLKIITRLTKRQLTSEDKYWKNFYHSFTNYLYNELEHFDNYVGRTIKLLRCFLNYIIKEKHLDIGFFHHKFYVPSEEIEIFTLSPERIHELIFDKEKEKTLDTFLQKTKDVFLFGCAVALRYSDLKALAPSNVEIISDFTYIRKLSLKTQTFTRIKLPVYALEILKKYLGLSKKHLLPQFTKEYMNKQIKKVMKHYGYAEPVVQTRTRRGIPVALKKKNGKTIEYNFCDVITTHTMRRTAITNLLSVGVPENIVRQLSGHSPQSKEFYRYVTYAQTLIDKEMDVAYSSKRGILWMAGLWNEE